MYYRTMINLHEQFDAPDDNATVWRFMDLARFLNLLETEALYFNRVDNFKDEYEGLPSQYNKTKWAEVYPEMFTGNGLPNETLVLEAIQRIQSNLRSQTFVSCWHLNEYESASMWDSYVKLGDGIAIKSRFGRLRNAFQGQDIPTLIGTVWYLDPNEWMREGNAYFPIFCKRPSFKHEQEVRILFQEQGLELFEDRHDKSKYLGHNIPIDLNILIEEIFISPDSPAWIVELITKISRKKLPDHPVTQSKLYKLK
jgi:hypothetical protein